LLAFYISGHGYGHASRQIEIINAVARRTPDARVFIRSSASRQLFERTVNPPFELDDCLTDTGVVQIDSLRLDEAETIRRAADFYRTLDSRARVEAELLTSRDVRFVVSDAPPLGCAAAALAGIPSAVVSNFTWDWIYAEYRECLASAPGLIPTIQRAYRQAEAAWRLPMHGGFETFDNTWLAGAAEARRRLDVPFVARHATHSREHTRARLGLPLDRRLALSSFGGYGADGIDFARLDSAADWDVVLTGNQDAPPPLAGTRFVHEPTLYAAGLRYEDLVAACDAVVTKPGYGIISECIANGTAMVYTSRGRFAEYDVLVREMPRYLRCAFLDQSSLLAGRWRAALDRAATAPPPTEKPATNGAQLIAERILSSVFEFCLLLFTQGTSDQMRGEFTFAMDTGFRSACARNAGRSRSALKPM
jgi:L-arabinokinase